MANENTQNTFDTGRLAVLLVAPFVCMAFSLLSIIFGLLPDEDIINQVQGILAGFSALSGGMSLIIGMTVLITQLVRNSLNAKNVGYFILAWFISVLIFIFALTLTF